MTKHLLPAIMLTVLMTVVTGLAYPLAMTGMAGLLFPHQAKGSLIERNGTIIGSELIGQNFATDGYFHGRHCDVHTDPNDPTKTVPAPYNASNSGGSNLGPTSKALVDRVKDDSDLLAATNPSAKVPVDLVTTSASGLDPDITRGYFVPDSVGRQSGRPAGRSAPPPRRGEYDWPSAWHTGRTACQCAKTQPCARQACQEKLTPCAVEHEYRVAWTNATTPSGGLLPTLSCVKHNRLNMAA